MNKKGQSGFMVVIVLLLIVIGILSYLAFREKSPTPPEENLPKITENQTETPNEIPTYQKCNVASDCNWDYTKYYNRNCTEGNWRCMESPVQGEFLCSYGCTIPENQYCGDGVCGGNGNSGENEWTCADCAKDVPYLGKLTI